MVGSFSFLGSVMPTGPEVVDVFRRCGITHVVWIPDSETGKWDAALSAAGTPQLIRPTREGEAIAIAAGLMLGGAKPLLVLQCTGLFEAGDALRNFVHDLKLPLPFIIGLRSYHAHKEGKSRDTCPIFTEPILRAWQLSYTILERGFATQELESALKQVVNSGKAGAVLLGE
jgi:sulfopyruvate decarboxylase TPP-binding subunit